MFYFALLILKGIDFTTGIIFIFSGGEKANGGIAWGILRPLMGRGAEVGRRRMANQRASERTCVNGSGAFGFPSHIGSTCLSCEVLMRRIQLDTQLFRRQPLLKAPRLLSRTESQRALAPHATVYVASRIYPALMNRQ